MSENTFKIDEITWNDLNMDQVLEILDKSESSVGREYIRDSLHTMQLEEAVLVKRSGIADYLSENKAVCSKLKKCFKDLGISKKVSFRDYIFRLNEIQPQSNVKHYILIILLIAAIVMLFIKPVIGIIGIVVMFALNISLYFADKAKIEGYFLCLKYLVRMVSCASKISNIPLQGSPLEEDRVKLAGLSKKFARLKRGSWLLTNSVSGSLADVVMDYVRMLFHVDLIKFNNMRDFAMNNGDSIDELYNTLGEMELYISACEFRNGYPEHCTPVFNSSLKIRGIYHPLIKEPVKNDLIPERSVLLTGSNASGKSTFLKSVAINQIFAQTIYTVLADEYETSFFKVLSSMALNDNILNNESYFVVEIKSLKRIFDNTGEVPVMCFIDEVLRGTNTKERIAASSVILEDLSEKNAFVFAATHDIELTQLLEKSFENYHFSESVQDSEVVFDYRIKNGPSTSRNAIKLLEVYGFDKNVIKNAEMRANS